MSPQTYVVLAIALTRCHDHLANHEPFQNTTTEHLLVCQIRSGPIG